MAGVRGTQVERLPVSNYTQCQRGRSSASLYQSPRWSSLRSRCVKGLSPTFPAQMRPVLVVASHPSPRVAPRGAPPRRRRSGWGPLSCVTHGRRTPLGRLSAETSQVLPLSRRAVRLVCSVGHRCRPCPNMRPVTPGRSYPPGGPGAGKRLTTSKRGWGLNPNRLCRGGW